MTQEQIEAVFTALQDGVPLHVYLKEHPEITDSRREVVQALVQAYNRPLIIDLLTGPKVKIGNISAVIDRSIKRLAAMPKFAKKKGVIRKAFNDMVDAL